MSQIHLFVCTDNFFDGMSAPDGDWVSVNGKTYPASEWREAIAYADSNDLWEPCSHGLECWLDVE